MSDEPKPGVIGSLPRTRPHRRSDKRPPGPVGAAPLDPQGESPALVTAAAAPKARTAKTPTVTKPAAKRRVAKAGPAANQAASRGAKPATVSPHPPAAAARDAARAVAPRPTSRPPACWRPPVQAAAELAEIGLHAGARALRRAVSRLPRP